MLLDTTGRDRSVPIQEIRDVKIKKKSKAGSYTLIGMALGVVAGAVFPVSENSLKFSPRNFVASSFIDQFRFVFSGGQIELNRNSAMSWFGLLGAGGGVIIGSVAGFDKKFSFMGKDPSSINTFLKDLHSKARIREFQ